MKKFQAYVNEQLEPTQLVNYKNYIFTQGIFITEDAIAFPWQSTSNFSDGPNYLKPRKQGIVFQFMQGVPAISVPVSVNESGNVIIDDIFEFLANEEAFADFTRYINVKNAIK